MPSTRLGPGRAGVARDLVAGLFLCLVAAAAYAGLGDLAISEGSGIGPGLVPKSVTAGITVFGLLIAGLGLVPGNDRIAGFSLRGPLFVLGAVVLFAATIRPLGLAVAGPLAAFIAGLADRETRPGELLVFSLALSALCIVLFKYILKLAMPLAPFLLGY